MPITITDLDNGLGNIIKGTGKVTGEEYCDVLNDHLSQPAEKMKRYIYSIADFTETAYVTVTLENVRTIAQKSLEIAALNPDVTVVITANEEVSLLLAELWQLFIEESGWDIHIFKSREELDDWMTHVFAEKCKKHRLSFA